jgi:hypothetical protein
MISSICFLGVPVGRAGWQLEGPGPPTGGKRLSLSIDRLLQFFPCGDVPIRSAQAKVIEKLCCNDGNPRGT